MSSKEREKDRQLVNALLSWYAKNGRQYPFRETKDPYQMIVCTMLLNRTTVKQVSSVFQAFFEIFPTVHDLAAASEDEVIDLIRPLGIRRRARDLISAARFIVNECDGAVPDDLDSLMKIKGVGRYVGSCVLAFAYGKKVPMVDSNVERVLCRIRGSKKPSAREKKEIWTYYEGLEPQDKVREFHCALIDLSHANCRPQAPCCASCALSSLCLAALRWTAAKEGGGYCQALD